MQPLKDVPEQGRPVSKPSVLVTRVVPLMLVIQVILTLVIYPFLPNIVPSHWNADGQIDSYEPKWIFVGFLPIFSLLLYSLFAAIIIFSRSRSSSAESGKIILKFVMLMQQSIFLVTQAVLLVVALHTGSGNIR